VNKTFALRLNSSRCLIGAVVLVNLQCAVVFFMKPECYVSAFELSGIPGTVVIRGMGVLFLMWSVPYLVALYDPLLYRIALYEAIAMQAIGLLGESFMAASLPNGYDMLLASLTRFIVFDALGLLALLMSLLLCLPERKSVSESILPEG
jgi:hypothetical protein